MWINESKRIYEFTVVSALAEEDEEGNIKIIKPLVKSKLATSLNLIDEVRTSTTDSGRISKKYCKIKVNNEEHTILGDYNYYKELIFKDKEFKRIGY